MILPAIATGQSRTIDSPHYGAKTLSALKLNIEKIVVRKKQTKIYMNCTANAQSAFAIDRWCRIEADGRQLYVQSAEGIKLGSTLPSGTTRFVLNFSEIDKNTESIDLVDDNAGQSFGIYDIALTDKAAGAVRARNALPDSIRGYATSIADTVQSLDSEEFTTDTAIVSGRIYGFDVRTFGKQQRLSVAVSIYNPFDMRQETHTAAVSADGTYEVQMPVALRHQSATVTLKPLTSFPAVITAGKAVVADIDISQLYNKPDNQLKPYFSGENADLNYALNQCVSNDFVRQTTNTDEAKNKIADFTAQEYKNYILNNYDAFCKRTDTMNVTPRAKELLKLDLKANAAYLLASGDSILGQARSNSGQATEKPEPVFDEEYSDYTQTLDIENVMMFYTDVFGYKIHDKVGRKNEKEPTYTIEETFCHDIVIDNGKITYDKKAKDTEGLSAFLKEFFERYYKIIETLEYADNSDMFDNKTDAYMYKTALELLIQLRRQSENDLRLSNIKYELKVQDYKVANNEISFTVLENCSYNFNFLPQFTSSVYGIENRFKLTKKDGAYKITSYRKIQDFYELIRCVYRRNEFYKTAMDRIKREYLMKFEKQNQRFKKMRLDYLNNNYTTKTTDNEYNRKAAYEYATYWVGRRNDKWDAFDGNNCANFASQMLNAGGIPMDHFGTAKEQWKFYSSRKNIQSQPKGMVYSWIQVVSLTEYFQRNKGFGLSGKVDENIYLAEPGDVMSVGPDDTGKHIIVVIDQIKDQNGNVVDLLIASNTVDLVYFPLSAYHYPYKCLMKVYGYNN